MSTQYIDNQQVIIMENYDYSTEATKVRNIREYDLHYDIPEPIDQWAVEDFEQFASLIIDGE